MKTKAKKLEAFRLREDVRKALIAIKRSTGKSKTRIIEEAVLIHAKSI